METAATDGGPILSIVVVNWNGERLLSDCLAPLMVPGFEVILVDNGSTDGSLSLLASRFPSVSVVANEVNVGFARACNQGLRMARADAVLFLNNDTVPNPEALAQLGSYLVSHAEVGVVGPTMVNADGSPQDSCGPGPNLWTELLGKSLLHRLVPGRRTKAPAATCRVDWVTGAALCIRRDLALALGGFDEAMFMFYEDLDLCARVRERGWEVWFVATPPIAHLGGATRRYVEAASLIHSYRSTDRYFAHHGPRWRRRCLQALTVPEMGLRFAIWSALQLSPSHRPLARQRLEAYRAILALATRSPGEAMAQPAPGLTAPQPQAATLSVAMCTYNGEKYLPQQLASLVAQTRPPDELVISDDASSDGTRALLRQFAAEAPFPVRLAFNDENLGFIRNFEHAISLCRSDLIALCDQDDVWQPTKLAKSLAILRDRPDVGLVFTDAEVVDAGLQPLGTQLQDHYISASDQALIAGGQAAKVLIRKTVVTGTTAVFRARFLPDILPVPAGWIHDAWISLVISVRANVVFIPETLVRYRQHEANQIGIAQHGFREQVQRASRAQRAEFQGDADRWKQARQRIARLGPLPDDAVSSVAREGIMRELAGMEGHMRTRADLPSSRARRLPMVGRELLRGNYHRYSAGLRSVAKDLVLRQADEADARRADPEP